MPPDRLPVRRALLSVSDKAGLLPLAQALSARGVALLSTGGTAKAIREAGLPVRDVSDVTGFPEIMDGRVKTLHPKVHGGLLGRRGTDDAVMAEHGIDAIDLLVLNLYPFERVAYAPGATFDDIVENIDIGGPAMLRAAAKNFAHVAVATDPSQYGALLAELDANDGALSARTRFALSVAAFNRVAQYDARISDVLSSIAEPSDAGAARRAPFGGQSNGNFTKVMDLRYGENPHQQAAFYRDLYPAPGTLATFEQLQGKALSYNNIADADSAWECVRQFDAPACVIVKHANPCGVAVGAACGDAYELAYATDPTSAFGGIIAFNRVAQYDAAISSYLSAIADASVGVPARTAFPAQANGSFVKIMDLRYGENPHQQAAFYRDLYPVPGTLATFEQLQGKALSFNNLADADAAWECLRQFDAPACVIVKHANPCGVALGVACGDAYELAYATDPTSAFGGIIAFNTKLDAATCKAILDRQFVEVLIAPDYEDGALDYARKKANVRVLRIPLAPVSRGFIDTKRVGSGLLMQTADDRVVTRDELKVVTKLAPTEAQFADLLFAWKVAKFVKSNAIVYARDSRSIGIGAGQMSRVVSAKIAGLKAEEAKLSVPGSVMASDAFFPFRDGIDAAAAAGIKAVIQPGGSMRDNEVIAAADEHGLAMVFTGVRHFRH